jgi:hypothetical protein
MEEPNILIKTALTEAVQKVNAGMSPTEALKKVANDLDLNPNYMQRTGEALNVALHYKHFKTAADRSMEFEIADIPKAISDNFTLTEKTAAEHVAENFSVSDVNTPVFNYNRMLSNPHYKQAFMEIANAPETHDSFATTFNTVYEKSANYVAKLTKQAEEAEVAKVAAEISLNEQFSILSDEFRKDAGYRTAFEEFESQVFAKHGEASLPYIELLHKTACPREERGVHDGAYMMFEQCKEAAMFDKLMLAADDFVSTQKEAADVAENLAFESSFLKECNFELGKIASYKSEQPVQSLPAAEKQASSEEQPESSDPVIAAMQKKAADDSYSVTPHYTKDPVLEQAMEKEAFGGSRSLLGELLREPVTEAFSSSFKKKQSPFGATTNLTLDNMERKLLLQELMLTDPILSKASPAKVVRAFEQILRLSPELSKEKEVVRAELRAMVASQALSKFDADLMTKLDVGMLKRRIATTEFNKGNIEQFRI